MFPDFWNVTYYQVKVGIFFWVKTSINGLLCLMLSWSHWSNVVCLKSVACHLQAYKLNLVAGVVQKSPLSWEFRTRTTELGSLRVCFENIWWRMKTTNQRTVRLFCVSHVTSGIGMKTKSNVTPAQLSYFTCDCLPWVSNRLHPTL